MFSFTFRTFLGEIYQCSADNVILTGDGEFLTEVRGDHMDGKSNFDVEALFVRDHVSNHMTRHIERFFPNLKSLTWVESNLLRISSLDLIAFPNLADFTIWISPLTYIEGNLFNYTPRLRHVGFFANSLRYVGDGLLDNLMELSRADFRSNPCIDMLADTPQQIELLKLQLRNCAPEMDTI